MLFLCMLLLLSGCGSKSPAPLITASNNAFSCTPQELIDLLNERAEASAKSNSDIQIQPIPNYQESDEKISILENRISITLSEDKNQQLNGLQFWWFDSIFAEKQVLQNAGFYTACIFQLFAPDYTDELYSMLTDDTIKGETYTIGGDTITLKEMTRDGIIYTYYTFNSDWNALEITPEKTPEKPSSPAQSSTGSTPSSSSFITVQNNAFSCTPQDLIDRANQRITVHNEKGSESEIPALNLIPDYTDPSNHIEYVPPEKNYLPYSKTAGISLGKNLSLTLCEKDPNLLQSFLFLWMIDADDDPEEQSDTLQRASYYLVALLDGFLPDDDDLDAVLDMIVLPEDEPTYVDSKTIHNIEFSYCCSYDSESHSYLRYIMLAPAL